MLRGEVIGCLVSQLAAAVHQERVVGTQLRTGIQHRADCALPKRRQQLHCGRQQQVQKLLLLLLLLRWCWRRAAAASGGICCCCLVGAAQRVGGATAAATAAAAASPADGPLLLLLASQARCLEERGCHMHLIELLQVLLARGQQLLQGAGVS
jgi:hypothetical protein